MNNRTPSRSFNTVKNSNREQRAKRRLLQRYLLLIAAALVVLILVAALAFLITGIVVRIMDNKTEPVQGGIEFEQLTKQSSDHHAGELILVNTSYNYVFPVSTANLVSTKEYRAQVDGSNCFQINTTVALKLDRTAMEAFNAMMLRHYTLSEGDGSILLSTTYRTLADQAALNSSIPAGASEHHTGYCLSLKAGDASELDRNHWVFENCYKYGFVIRYPNAKSGLTGVTDYENCLRYVGIPHASYMQSSGMCLEEYLELLRTNYASSDNRLKITGADGNNYEVYYIPAASTEITTLKVPKNYQYTISGDNIGGFIVTVNTSAPK